LLPLVKKKKMWFVKLSSKRPITERSDYYEIIRAIFNAETYYCFYSSYLSVKCWRLHQADTCLKKRQCERQRLWKARPRSSALINLWQNFPKMRKRTQRKRGNRCIPAKEITVTIRPLALPFPMSKSCLVL